MLEVKSEKMVKYLFPKSFLDDLGGVSDTVGLIVLKFCKYDSIFLFY